MILNNFLKKKKRFKTKDYQINIKELQGIQTDISEKCGYNVVCR